jgi:hypothetical protein
MLLCNVKCLLQCPVTVLFHMSVQAVPAASRRAATAEPACVLL